MPIPSAAPYAQQAGHAAAEPFVDMIKELVEQGKPIPPLPIIVTPPTATDQIFNVIRRIHALTLS